MARILGNAESECVELFRHILNDTAVMRQHTFAFLRGDSTPSHPNGVKLRVDAFFPQFLLVVEYMGAQHDKSNALMDRRPGRRDQRARYQERRTEVLRQNGIRLIRVSHAERLDEELVRAKLREVGISA